ncbi:TetR/AcrR family transcriptional regulator [Acetobacter conturbans]|uniref:TetR family transcriptional regulator n=1 Tax=Acetobacter conturbans TaxID=1737472 RepID=A0ABX0K7Y4_9PROT|nr:TetR/AcrR family transcriptional regulator [Acetobacter conturbans]NHN89514.1 TetR family transcriptional regulator [Acetobacter conturbans]
MRVRTEARREAILKIAGCMFLQQGYASTSMAAVAAELGGSKSTLYGYFPSKEELFTAFVIDAGEDAFAALHDIPVSFDDFDKTLTLLGRRYLQLLLSPRIIAICRLVIAESTRFPELGLLFFENGPKRVVGRIAGVLEAGVSADVLVPLNPLNAALQFKALCEAGIYEKLLWGLEESVAPEIMEAKVESAVEMFLARYGPSSQKR